MDVDVERARVSVALSSFVFAEGDSGSTIDGGSINSSSSGKYCLARLGVDVLLLSTFLPGVSIAEGSKRGDGDEGPAPGVEAYGVWWYDLVRLERFRVGLVVVDKDADEMDFDAGRFAFLIPSQDEGEDGPV